MIICILWIYVCCAFFGFVFAACFGYYFSVTLIVLSKGDEQFYQEPFFFFFFFCISYKLGLLGILLMCLSIPFLILPKTTTNIGTCYCFTLLRLFPISVSCWFLIWVWVTASFPKSPGLSSVFSPIFVMLLSGWLLLVLGFLSIIIIIIIITLKQNKWLFWTTNFQSP